MRRKLLIAKLQSKGTEDRGNPTFSLAIGRMPTVEQR